MDNGQSEIKLTKLEFARPPAVADQYDADEGFTGLVQAVIFEVGDRDLIGHPTPSGYRYCCTKELVSKTKCHQDRLIYRKKDDGWPKVLDIYFENNDTIAYSWEEAITIDKTGMYYLWFVTCDEDLSAVTVNGATEWKNPTGECLGRRGFSWIVFYLARHTHTQPELCVCGGSEGKASLTTSQPPHPPSIQASSPAP